MRMLLEKVCVCLLDYVIITLVIIPPAPQSKYIVYIVYVDYPIDTSSTSATPAGIV